MRRPRHARPQLVELEDRVTPATRFTVTGTGDDNTRDDVLTLREALLAQRGDITLSAAELAHVTVSAPGLTRDTIGFEPALGGQTVTFGTSDTSAANPYGPTDFVVTTPVTIDGTGGSGLGVTVSGGNARRLFAVTSAGDLGLTNLTLADGLAQGGAGQTGSVVNKITNVISGGGGGGAAGLGGAVFVDGGVLTVMAGTLTGPPGGRRGRRGRGHRSGRGSATTGRARRNGRRRGALWERQRRGRRVRRRRGRRGSPACHSTPSPPASTASPGGAGGFGGGGGAAGSVASLVGGRGGGGAGLGGAVFNNAGTVTLTNSTRTANTAVGGSGATAGKGYGGAVFSRNGTLTITSSTLSANTAADGGTDVYVLADAVSAVAGDTRNTGAAAVVITGSILGQTANTVTDLTTATNGTGATVTASGAFNLIRNTAVAGVGNLSTADPRLSPVGAFGGPTRKLALLGGSPALDAGDPTATAADQRGAAVYNGRRDVGAFEQAAAGALTITGPGALPACTVGEAYSETFAAAGSAGPFTFAVSGGALPAGLTLSPAGLLSGTATATGSYTVTVIAHDPSGASGTRDYTLVVVAAIVLTPAPLLAATRGAAYSQLLTADGSAAPFTFAVTAGGLPTGVALAADGTLAGTPGAGGTQTYTFTVTATSSTGYAGTRQYTLTVNSPVVVAPAAAALPTVAQGQSFTQAFTAAGATGPFTFARSTGSLPAGLSLDGDGTLSGTPTEAGTFAFAVTATSAAGYTGSRAYTLVVNPVVLTLTPAALPAAGQGAGYTQTFAASGSAGPFTFAVTAGALPAGLTLTTAGVLSGTPTVAGTFAFTVTATAASSPTGSRASTLVVNPATVTVGPAALPGGLIGTGYAQTLTATGVNGPFTFAVTAGALPAGLTLAADGALAGVLAPVGSYAFTVTATSAGVYSGSRAYMLAVGAPPIALDPAALPDAVTNRPYTRPLTASGAAGPFTFAVTAGALPVGLTLAANGTLSGTPRVDGSATFTVTATSAVGYTGSREYTLAAVPGLVLTPQVPPVAAVGVPFAEQLFASGAPGPVAFAVPDGALPPGLSLTAGGQLSGTPTADGRYTFSVGATAANGLPGYQRFTVVVAGAREVTPAAMPLGQVGQRVELTLGLTAAGAPPTVAVTAGALPPGLSLSGGVVRGTPTAAGTFAFTVTAAAAGGAVSRAYDFRVVPAPVPGPTACVVTSLADDGAPGTLRYAVNAANADATAAPVAITFAVGGTVLLTGGPIELTRAGGPVSIDAAGHAVTLDANHAGRVLANVATGPVTVTGLTLRNGRADATTSGDSGGGVLNGGVLTLVRVAVLDNDAAYSGGGVYNGHALTLIDSTVAGNACAGLGGGVYNGTGATLTATNCTLVNNTAASGGAVLNGGTFTATNSTVSGNTARYAGGGVYNGATFAATGSIVTANALVGTGGSGPNVSGGVSSDGGYNLLATELRPATPAAGDVFTDAPGLAPLADNGGPTPTAALLAGSPALDAGRPTDAGTDQRGVAVQNGRRDIGAFESGFAAPPPAATTTTTADAALATYGGAQLVMLTAATTGSGGMVTFAVTDAAGRAVGIAVTASVAGGAAAAAFTLPGRTPAGGYRVTATYSGSPGSAASAGTATLTVAPAVLTVSGLAAADKVYDDTTTAALLTGPAALVGVGTGDDVTLNASAAVGTFASANVSAAVAVTVTGLALAGAAAGNYVLVTPTAAAAIRPRPFTVTAAANSKPFDGTTAAATLPTVSGLQGDDAAAFTESYADSAVGTGKLLTPAGVVLDGNGGANYAVTVVPAATGTILASVATSVSLGAPAAVVYGTPVTLSATVTSGMGTPTGAVTFFDDTAGVALGAGVDQGGGVWAYTTAPGQLAAAPGRALRAAFTPTGPFLSGAGSAAVAVAPRALTVTGLAAADKLFDGTTAAVVNTTSAALVGTVPGDGVALDATGAGGVFAAADVGNGIAVAVSGLALTGAAAANYTLTTPALTAAITPAPAAVVVAPATGTAGRPITLTATVAGLGQPLDGGVVTFTVGGTSVVAQVVGGVAVAAVALPAGTYAVGAAFGGNGNFAAAAATATLVVTAAAVEPGPNLVGVQQVMAGADGAGGGAVIVYNPDGSDAAVITPFPGTGVPVRTAAGDFNRDGTPDVIAGTGPGATARVKVIDGRTGGVLFDTLPFEDFTGGVFVAAADITGDGTPELVVTPDQSGGPRVVVYDGAGFRPMSSFLGIDDANFRGGARAGVGDVNADGFADLVLSAGFGGGPRVAVFDGRALAAGRVERLVNDFFLFEERLRNGAYVAVGDVDGDGFADVVGGAGPGGAPRVLVLSGRQLLTAGPGAALAASVADFFAGDVSNRGGVRVAVKNLDADRFADVVVGDAAGAGSRVRAYSGRELAGGSPYAAYELDPFPGTLGGVYVG